MKPKGSRKPASAFTLATRAKLMLLAWSVDECQRNLGNITSQLRRLSSELAETIRETKTKG